MSDLTAPSPLLAVSTERLAAALREAWSEEWANRPNDLTMARLATALLASGAVVPAASLAEESSFIYRVTDQAIPMHPTGRVTVTETQAVLRALAAALEDR